MGSTPFMKTGGPILYGGTHLQMRPYLDKVPVRDPRTKIDWTPPDRYRKFLRNLGPDQDQTFLRNPGPTRISTKYILENPDRLGPGSWIPDPTEISAQIFDAYGIF